MGITTVSMDITMDATTVSMDITMDTAAVSTVVMTTGLVISHCGYVTAMHTLLRAHIQTA